MKVFLLDSHQEALCIGKVRKDFKNGGVGPVSARGANFMVVKVGGFRRVVVTSMEQALRIPTFSLSRQGEIALENLKSRKTTSAMHRLEALRDVEHSRWERIKAAWKRQELFRLVRNVLASFLLGFILAQAWLTDWDQVRENWEAAVAEGDCTLEPRDNYRLVVENDRCYLARGNEVIEAQHY